MAEDVVVDEEPKKKSKLKIILPVLVLLAGLGGAAYFFVIAPKMASAKETTTTTEAHGKIIRLAPVTMNLSDGHVLKVGIALQMAAEPKDLHLNGLVGLKATAGAGHESSGEATITTTLDGLESKALDEMILELGNHSYEELSAPGGRAKAKTELSEKIEEIYHGDVEGVYFTDFVMS